MLSCKVILGNPFLALLYPFSTIDNGIYTNIFETDVFFKFILPPIPNPQGHTLIKRNLHI